MKLQYTDELDTNTDAYLGLDTNTNELKISDLDTKLNIVGYKHCFH